MPWPSPPSKLYKYLVPARLDVLERPRLRFTPPGAFNDPFDCRGPARSIVTRDGFDDGGLQVIPQRMSDYAKRRIKEEVELFVQRASEYEKSKSQDQMEKPSGSFEISNLDLRVEVPLDFTGSPLKVDFGFENVQSDFQMQPFILGGRGWMQGALSPTSERPIVTIGGYDKQNRFNQVGVLSLSARPDSAVMWSHYADSHRGFVIGLDTNHDFFERDIRTFHVKEFGYTDILDLPADLAHYSMSFDIPSERQLRIPPIAPVMYGDLRASSSPATPRESKLRDTPEFEFMDFSEMLFKADDWSYEQEWRMFRRLENQCHWDDQEAIEFSTRPGFQAHATPFSDWAGMPVTLFDLPPSCIKEIILGINMSIEDRRRAAKAILGNPELRHVALRLGVSNPFTYSVDTVPADLGSVMSSVDLTLEELRQQSDFREAIQFWPIRLLQAMIDRLNADLIQDMGFSKKFAIEALKAELRMRTPEGEIVSTRPRMNQ